jgi:hypothetical protein
LFPTTSIEAQIQLRLASAALSEQTQLLFRNYKLRKATSQANHKFREYKYMWFINIPQSRKMDDHLSGEPDQAQRVARSAPQGIGGQGLARFRGETPHTAILRLT